MEGMRIGTRKSKLAMWQTETVARALELRGIETEIRGMETKGDKILGTSIAKIGSKGVFTEELEQQLVRGETDIAVHSAKDMQSHLPEGFDLIAFTKRERVNDVLISHRDDIDIADKRRPLRIGTSSVRRVALLKHYHPHLQTVEMRGNLQTRIGKMEAGQCDALMLAYAGVFRMGFGDMIIHTFPDTTFIPPVGQGCIAVEAHSRLALEKRELVREAVNDEKSEICLAAERAFLKKLEGGCSIPVFGLATLESGEINLTGGLASLDGKAVLKHTIAGPRDHSEAIGKELGEYILANGGREMLQEIRRQQD